jgi:hypothetical protein
MTSQGSAYGRFSRAIAQRKSVCPEIASRELRKLSLLDALDYVELLAEVRPDRVEPAAIRWHGRLELKERALTMSEAQLALAALADLRRGTAGRHAASPQALEACEADAGRRDAISVEFRRRWVLQEWKITAAVGVVSCAREVRVGGEGAYLATVKNRHPRRPPEPWDFRRTLGSVRLEKGVAHVVLSSATAAPCPLSRHGSGRPAA